MREMNWEVIAKMAKNAFGSWVDWEERFFECPECGGEPIYECDWDINEFFDEEGNLICPVCENILLEVDEIEQMWDEIENDEDDEEDE